MAFPGYSVFGRTYPWLWFVAATLSRSRWPRSRTCPSTEPGGLRSAVCNLRRVFRSSVPHPKLQPSDLQSAHTHLEELQLQLVTLQVFCLFAGLDYAAERGGGAKKRGLRHCLHNNNPAIKIWSHNNSTLERLPMIYGSAGSASDFQLIYRDGPAIEPRLPIPVLRRILLLVG